MHTTVYVISTEVANLSAGDLFDTKYMNMLTFKVKVITHYSNRQCENVEFLVNFLEKV